MKRGCTLTILAMLASACDPAEPPAPLTASEAIQRANADFAQALPQVPLHELNVEASDAGGQWRMIYRLPQGSTGPGFLGPIMVDKRTGAIVQGMKGPNYIEAEPSR